MKNFNTGQEEADIKPRVKRSMKTDKISVKIESVSKVKFVYMSMDMRFRLSTRRDRAALQRIVNIINTALEEEI